MTTANDVRIADDVGDGGRSIARAHTAGAAGAVVGLVIGTVIGASSAGPWWSLVPALGAAGALAGHDRHERRLPDLGIAAVAVLGVAAAVAAAATGRGLDGAASWGSGALAMAAPLLVIHLVAPGSMGFGDVKFAAVLGGLVGVVGVDTGDRFFLAMVALTVAGVGATLDAAVARRSAVAFGPWLFVGTAATLVVAALTRSPS